MTRYVDTADYGKAAGPMTIGTAGNVTGSYTAKLSGGSATDQLTGIEAIIGSPFADIITTQWNAVIDGGLGDDTVTTSPGNDTINGGGNDVAVYHRNRSEYTVTISGGVVTVADRLGYGYDGTDTLTAIERLQFRDGVVQLPRPTVPRPALPDFNGDGRGDIVWQDGSGSIAAWLMNGTTPAAAALLLGSGSGCHRPAPAISTATAVPTSCGGTPTAASAYG